MIINEQISGNIFKAIKQQFGAPCWLRWDCLKKTRLEITRYSNHLRFSLRCRHNDIIPKDGASRELFQERIHLYFVVKNNLQNRMTEIDENIHAALSSNHYDQMIKVNESSCLKEMRLCKARYLKKFSNINRPVVTENTSIDTSKCVMNFSFKQLSEKENRVLFQCVLLLHKVDFYYLLQFIRIWKFEGKSFRNSIYI